MMSILKVIPLQIDQKLVDGFYAYASGKGAVDDADTTLDVNDEIVFMAKDLGNRAPEGILPAGALAGIEIEVTDPLNKGKAWHIY